jgi:hypothetical protein
MKNLAILILMLATTAAQSAIVQVTLEGTLQNYSSHPEDVVGLNGSAITLTFSYDDSVTYDAFYSCNCNSGGSYNFQSAFGSLQAQITDRNFGLQDFEFFSHDLSADAISSFDGDTLSMHAAGNSDWLEPIASTSGIAILTDVYLGNVNLSMAGGALPGYAAWNGNEYWWNDPSITLSIDGTAHNYSLQNLTSSAVLVSTVPIPAAVWLFGSALAGLGWMRRRKTV